MRDPTRGRLKRSDKGTPGKRLSLLRRDVEHPGTDARVTRAIEVMHESFAHQLSITGLSKGVNLSSARLRQIFKAEIGVSLRNTCTSCVCIMPKTCSRTHFLVSNR